MRYTIFKFQAVYVMVVRCGLRRLLTLLALCLTVAIAQILIFGDYFTSAPTHIHQMNINSTM